VRPRFVRIAFVVIAGSSAASLGIACGSFDSAEPSPPEDAAPDTDASAVPDDGGRDDGALPSDSGIDAGPCPGMVVVPSAAADGGFYCIDATEVTQEQYQKFLAAKAGATSGQVAKCASNTTFLPANNVCPRNLFEPTTRGAYPVSCVDWCDAVAYCEWAGKRLCGAVGGGSLPNAKIATVESQWYAACSHHDDGLHTLAYGNTYDPTRCNGAGFDSGVDGGAPIPVRSLAACEGGYPGIFDMMGNVYEWEDSYDPDGVKVHVRGGQYAGGATYHYCAWGDITFTASFAAADIGFRCCSR
jgi:sulfatase modifying factor 1